MTYGRGENMPKTLMSPVFSSKEQEKPLSRGVFLVNS